MRSVATYTNVNSRPSDTYTLTAPRIVRKPTFFSTTTARRIDAAEIASRIETRIAATPNSRSVCVAAPITDSTTATAATRDPWMTKLGCALAEPNEIVTLSEIRTVMQTPPTPR